MGDRGEISRQRVGFEAAMHCPAGNEVGEPPKNPDEEIAFAKSAEHKQAGGQDDERSRLLCHEPGDSHVPDHQPVGS